MLVISLDNLGPAVVTLVGLVRIAVVGSTAGLLLNCSLPTVVAKQPEMRLLMMQAGPNEEGTTHFSRLALAGETRLVASEVYRKDSTGFDHGYRHGRIVMYDLAAAEVADPPQLDKLWQVAIDDPEGSAGDAIVSSEADRLAVGVGGQVFFGGYQDVARGGDRGTGPPTRHAFLGGIAPDGSVIARRSSLQEPGEIYGVSADSSLICFAGTKGEASWNYIACKPGGFLMRCRQDDLDVQQLEDEYPKYGGETGSCVFLACRTLLTGDALVLGYGRESREESQHYILRKSDPDGSTIWEQQIPSPSRNAMDARLQIDSSGNAYVATSLPDDKDGFSLAKFSPEGSRVWERSFNRPQSADATDAIRDLVVTPEGVSFVAFATRVFRLSTDGALRSRDASIRDAILERLEKQREAVREAMQEQAAQSVRQEMQEATEEEIEEAVEEAKKNVRLPPVALDGRPADATGPFNRNRFSIESIAVSPDHQVYVASRNFLFTFSWTE
ncbi:hypothetical protein [Botrimarina mediterranea]|uniref:hypothetical protein n=1 Tax=Botrimarina mediterranea TaxID=2528022 RepID=UPI001189C155|nr:hypothetical protein K2D_47100 [Planctomycetes bacterium K2D]